MEALQTFNNELIPDFECVVCLEYMHPPIIQCTEGHSVCHQCHKKLGRCPTCRQQFDIRCRARVLERLHKKLVFPCKFQEQGCKEQLHGGLILEHEACCDYNVAESTEGATSRARRDAGSGDNRPQHQEVAVQVLTRYFSMLEELADLVQYY